MRYPRFLRFGKISYGETTVRLFAETQKTNKAVILGGEPLSCYSVKYADPGREPDCRAADSSGGLPPQHRKRSGHRSGSHFHRESHRRADMHTGSDTAFRNDNRGEPPQHFYAGSARLPQSGDTPAGTVPESPAGGICAGDTPRACARRHDRPRKRSLRRCNDVHFADRKNITDQRRFHSGSLRPVPCAFRAEAEKR